MIDVGVKGDVPQLSIHDPNSSRLIFKYKVLTEPNRFAYVVSDTIQSYL